MKYERGTLRLVIGLLGLLGIAGAADQSPLTLSMIPQALAFALVGTWGVARMHHGPLLRLVRWPASKAQRRQWMYVRAGGRA